MCIRACQLSWCPCKLLVHLFQELHIHPPQNVSPVCTTSNQMFIQEIALNVAEPI